MCWSVPGEITEVKGNVAKVEISGVKREVAMDLIDNPKIGEYVLIHAGYALQRVDEGSAKFTIDFFKNKGQDAQIS